MQLHAQDHYNLKISCEYLIRDSLTQTQSRQVYLNKRIIMNNHGKIMFRYYTTMEQQTNYPIN